VIVALLISGLCLLVLGGNNAGTGAVVIIESLGGEKLVLDINEHRTVGIEGPLGTTTIVIERNTVRFVDSPCPHRLCVGRGPISRAGEWIACLPNGVVARISGQSAYDGITP
jgi:hypothetical protein